MSQIIQYLSGLTPPVIGAFNEIVVQVFTTPGDTTYVPTAGMQYCTIEVVGGGGGGGGSGVTFANTVAAGQSGGAGAYARRTVPASLIGAGADIEVGFGGPGGIGSGPGGSGGDSDVGNFLFDITCTGGGGGSAGSDGATSVLNGASGGSCPSNDIDVAIEGGFGSACYASFASELMIQGGGGIAPVYGSPTVTSMAIATSILGANAFPYGCGGAAGVAWEIEASGVAGGNGSPGIVIITEYISN